MSKPKEMRNENWFLFRQYMFIIVAVCIVSIIGQNYFIKKSNKSSYNTHIEIIAPSGYEVTWDTVFNKWYDTIEFNTDITSDVIRDSLQLPKFQIRKKK